MSYRLKVCYRGNWKFARKEHESLEEARASQEKLLAMGVKSKLCDSTGKEVKNNGSCF